MWLPGTSPLLELREDFRGSFELAHVRTRLDKIGTSSNKIHSFDGSNTSISGNGNFVAHNASQGLPSGLLDIQPGTGGVSLLSYLSNPLHTDISYLSPS